MTPPPATPALPTDLEAGLKRLKLAAIRRAAPDILLTAAPNVGNPKKPSESSSISRSPPATNPTVVTR